MSEGKREGEKKVMPKRSLPTSHQQISAQPVLTRWYLGQTPRPAVLLLRMTLRGMEDPSGPLGSAVSPEPPQLLPHPQPLAAGAFWFSL